MGIKAVSLTSNGQGTFSSDKQIISSVLFEYASYGAYIHYFETTNMKKSSFTNLFVLKEENKEIAKEKNITNDDLLYLDG